MSWRWWWCCCWWWWIMVTVNGDGAVLVVSVCGGKFHFGCFLWANFLWYEEHGFHRGVLSAPKAWHRSAIIHPAATAGHSHTHASYDVMGPTTILSPTTDHHRRHERFCRTTGIAWYWTMLVLLGFGSVLILIERNLNTSFGISISSIIWSIDRDY